MRHSSAFTIIEVLVSVVLISVVVLGIVKIQQDNSDMALYLSDRSKQELTNTLFLGRDIMKYHKDEKDAHTMLSNRFSVSDFRSREILKDIKRKIFISEPLKLEDETLPIEVNEIMLKGQYSSRFIHFQIK
ncbi:hypothetical protein MNB_SV-6-697 [hydrothermal vent metagenome]|uniref:Prepilin-type N-terminal cleavage/methylation domain-containing protein n=1 Tax=hydrothermal vent metagenome TaxID=652676 RepID=A0A1W1BUG2_9ZZZZ